MSKPNDAPPEPPRLCHISKWDNFDGYGFNLHSDKSKPGQYIGKIDAGSPAEAAWLREGDRIIEVNGVNIANENHKQVVSRIKLVPGHTDLLVVSTEADVWYKKHNIVVSSDLPEVVRGTSVRPPPTTNGVSGPHEDEPPEEDKRSLASGSSSEASNAPQDHVPEASETAEEAIIPVITTDGPSDDSDRKSTSSEPKTTEDSIKDHDDIQESTKDHVDIQDSTSSDHGDAECKQEIVTQTEIQLTEMDSKSAAPGELKEPSEASIPNEANKRHSLSSSSSASIHESEDSSARTGSTGDKSPMSTSPSPPLSLETPSPMPTSAEPPKSTPTTTTTATARLDNADTGGLNLNMTAAEMKAYLASKKKADIRHDNIDLRKKYEIIQKL